MAQRSDAETLAKALTHRVENWWAASDLVASAVHCTVCQQWLWLLSIACAVASGPSTSLLRGEERWWHFSPAAVLCDPLNVVHGERTQRMLTHDWQRVWNSPNHDPPGDCLGNPGMEQFRCIELHGLASVILWRRCGLLGGFPRGTRPVACAKVGGAGAAALQWQTGCGCCGALSPHPRVAVTPEWEWLGTG